jgi:rhamnosyltransferase
LTNSQFPRVAVLMATYNGMEWLQAQLDSILTQENVDVTLYVSDDGSSDGTDEALRKLSQIDSRVVVLPKIASTGSAGRNFYRLIRDVDADAFDYVALADQDDIWHQDKLIRHIHLINRHQVAAVSSNVTAFWPNGTEQLIVKSQPQLTWDFLFESAGPGCSFLMTPWLVARVREQLLKVNSQARQIALHDWLIYAVCRAYGAKWIIDANPSLYYRQHALNVVGANSGMLAKWKRLILFQQGWYRAEVVKVSQVCASINHDG